MRKLINAFNWEMVLTSLYLVVVLAACVALAFEKQLMAAFR